MFLRHGKNGSNGTDEADHADQAEQVQIKRDKCRSSKISVDHADQIVYYNFKW